ncbi:protein tyrosine phosphatase [Stylonychia lemnae]|uniref:Protein tyrosine phosphatase n=1 Tax=Stylonychia lemnae TaxID=5949 RepID=A0A078A030_STYLE|nr:protein tyrosine phosphatase [Stylonychia lemnae]|eukprot:CDW75541.1 protein tyrosine phosphatase [Stylonychia lemnae]
MESVNRTIFKINLSRFPYIKLDQKLPQDLSYEAYKYDKNFSNFEYGMDVQRILQTNEKTMEIEYEGIIQITDKLEAHQRRLNTNKNVTHLNRYTDILPCILIRVMNIDEDTRVKLQARKGRGPTDDYINANYINVKYSQRFVYLQSPIGNDQRIIATQGPTKYTVESFWRMVLEQNVGLIMTVANEKEHGKEKFLRYWPEKQTSTEEDFQIGNLLIYNTFESNDEKYTHLIKRIFYVMDQETGVRKKVVQMHYLGWPDYGIPSNESLEDFNVLLQHGINFLVDDTKKIVIHCSAGIGRTGTTLSLMQLIMHIIAQKEQRKNIGSSKYPIVQVFSTVRKLREQRMFMVQTIDQYIFIYKYMKYWIQTYLSEYPK